MHSLAIKRSCYALPVRRRTGLLIRCRCDGLVDTLSRTLVLHMHTSIDRSSGLFIRLDLKINGHVSAPLVFTGIFSAEECQGIMDLSETRHRRIGTMMYARPDIRTLKTATMTRRPIPPADKGAAR